MFISIGIIQQLLQDVPGRMFFIVIGMCLACGCDSGSVKSPKSQTPAIESLLPGPVVVAPGADLQKALDRAFRTSSRTLRLKPGVYHSETQRFCLLSITARHDGITVEGMDGVTLSARSRSDPDKPMVSHVLYCGDGVTSKTTIRNLTITGAKGLATDVDIPQEDFGLRSQKLQQGLFFVMDGGAAKMFGACSPSFENIDFVDNETALCGGAVSIEQQGFRHNPVTFRNCRFLRNRCPATGSAVDVLQGSSVKLDNCLFVDNIGNYGMAAIKKQFHLEYNSKHGCGALTVFPGSTAFVTHCTFYRNWSAVDDRGTGSRYEMSIFAKNDVSDGSRDGKPYELDVIDAHRVTGCLFHSEQPDLQRSISVESNRLNAPDPEFNHAFVPTALDYANVGFRPNPE